MARICVIGGGPAGSVFSSRMAALGHDVTLIERLQFPRRRLGESLSPGVLPLLETIGARPAIENAGFLPVESVLVEWDGARRLREDPRKEGLLVDRGAFDRLLLSHAEDLGVRVLQPARLLNAARVGNGWTVGVEADGRLQEMQVDFLADASGRSGARKHRTGCRTLALYAYWQGTELPLQPRMEAGEDAWYWGVPLPGRAYNTLVFVDAVRFRAQRKPKLHDTFMELLSRSRLMEGCRDAVMTGSVQATDATPYLDENSLTETGIKIGDAALAVDPISSSGVQKAIQSALSAAATVNTLLCKPELSDAAIEFYRTGLSGSSKRHSLWASDYYGQAAAFHGGSFWADRSRKIGESAKLQPSSQQEDERADAASLLSKPVHLSSQLAFTDLPCIDGDFIAVKTALRHPRLDAPVAYLGGHELAPMLADTPEGATALEIAQSWSDRIPLRQGLAITAWLVNNGILVSERSDGDRSR